MTRAAPARMRRLLVAGAVAFPPGAHAAGRAPAVPHPPAPLAGLLRGRAVPPTGLLILDAGRLRTLELDDRTPLRLRVTLPF
ncbi:hypothetical protein [uncultured Methylobacterium sp.]|uniref:hypothetical protein n=1 Tax=uncultured Methylobacterium sp. TaxID=157278 RepID=UPI0035CC95BA